jgi:hypothetical protein
MHPFLERLVDVELLREKRAIHPNELDFFQIVDCGRQPPRQLIDLLAGSLAKTYPKAAKDSSLKDRLEAAYLDTRGYYQFTNYVDQDYLEAGLKREEDEKMTRKWLSIIHPPEVPQELDVLNTTHQTWPHPCNERETSTKSFLELYNDARAECAGVCRTIHAAWTAPDAGAQIEHAVGNWNLSDGRKTERPCKKRHSAPLPLSEVQNRIRESIRSGNGGRLS